MVSFRIREDAISWLSDVQRTLAGGTILTSTTSCGAWAYDRPIRRAEGLVLYGRLLRG